MDFIVALQEYNDRYNKLQLINILQMTMDYNGEVHIETKKKEQTNTIENKSIQLEINQFNWNHTSIHIKRQI